MHPVYDFIIRNEISLIELNNRLVQHDKELKIKTISVVHKLQRLNAVDLKRKQKKSMAIFFGIILEDLENYILQTREKLDGNTNTK